MNLRRGFPRPIPTQNTRKLDTENGLGLLDIWQVIWRGRKLVLLLGLLGCLLGAIYGFGIARPQYQATAQLVLTQPTSPVSGLITTSPNLAKDLPSLNTELHIIRSRGLVRKLVKELALENDPEFASDGRLLLSVPGGEPEMVVQNLRAGITASVPRNTHLISITARSQDRSKAALIANTLAQLYVEAQTAAMYSADQNAVKWLSDRVAALHDELTIRDRAIAALNARTDLKSVEELALTKVRLKDVRARLVDVSSNADKSIELEEEFQQLRRSGQWTTISQLVEDAQLERSLQNGDHAEMGDDVDVRLNEIETRLQLRARRLTQQKAALALSVQKLEADVQQQDADFAELQQLEREAQATRVLYETLLSRQKETSAFRGLRQAEARILSPALSGIYQSPRTSLTMLLLSLVGGGIASAFLLFRQFVHTGFRTAEELEKVSGTPVLGQIPIIPVGDRSGLIQFLSDHPTAAANEAIRNFRTSLFMSNVDHPPQVILSASSVPGEGKTTQAVTLAKSTSGLDKTVLLIEGDMRRRTFENYFPTNLKSGIGSVLAGELSLGEAIQPIPELGADVLIAEHPQSSAVDMFASQGFEDLINTARKAYDVIIVDTPPVLAVPDARVLAGYADAIVFSVAWDSTTRKQVREGLRQFEMVNCPVTGLVLAQIEPVQMARYGYAETNPAYVGFGAEYYSTT